MQEIIEQAGSLGRAIAGSPQAARLRQARADLEAKKDLLDLLKDYHAQADKIAAMEEQNKPVEVGDKHKLQELHDRLIASEVFKKYTSAQVDYVDLMRNVSDALRRELSRTEGGEDQPAAEKA